MSKAYIPKDTWVVCTYQQNPSPQKLIPTRAKRSVFYKKDMELLTIEDRNTKEKFVCKSPMNFAMGLGGLLVGVFLASNPIGWAVAGVCAVILVAAATIAIVTHDCTGHLQAGIWINEKQGVKFDGFLAITETSMLMCDTGGILQPIISYDVAKQTAKEIASANIKETTIVTVGAIASGYLMGKGGGIIKTISGIFTKSGALFTIGGIGATYAMTSYQSNAMRNNEDYADNEIYQRMNKEQELDWGNPNKVSEEVVDVLIENVKSGNPPNINDLYGVVQLQKTGRLIIQDQQLLSRFNQIKDLTRQQLYRSDIAQSILDDFQSGSFSDVNNAIKRNPMFNQYRITPTMRENARNFIDTKIRGNKWSLNNPNSLLSKATGIALFFVPLATNYFSEEARRTLAENAIQDATNSISVRTSN